MHLNIQSHLEFEKYRVDFNLQGGFTLKDHANLAVLCATFPSVPALSKLPEKMS